MRKQLIPLIITLLFFMGNNCFAQFGGGNGTAGNPYQISNVTQLNYFSSVINGSNPNTYNSKFYILTTNIDMNGASFIPIGDNINNNRRFQGNFNGNGKVIRNCTISSGAYVGLFGYTVNATISNLGIEGFDITANGDGFGGGLVGYAATGSTINECYVIASIKGNKGCNLGGLIGIANGTEINNCYARASFSNSNPGNSGDRFYGGLVASLQDNSKVNNSYSAPTAAIPSGGANGSARGILVGRIINCSNPNPNSYYESTYNVSGMTIFGTPKTTIEMKDIQLAIDLNVFCQNENWKFDNIPTLVNEGYPILFWQAGGSLLPSCFSGGDGNEADPFRIRYVKDLIQLSTFVSSGNPFPNTYFRVENNISFVNGANDSSSYFLPIGNRNYAFQGNFDGNGKVISNLTINSGNYVGLFGYISGATIDSLGIENFTYVSNRFGGGLVAYAYNSTINYSYSIGKLTSTGNNSTTEYPELGGLIGHLDKSSLNNCYARARIYDQTGNDRSSFGGLVAHIHPQDISYINNSYAASYPIPRVGDYGSLLGYVRNDYNFSETNSYHYDLSGMNRDYGGTAKDSTEMKSGCFVVSLNGTQPSIVWFKAKSQVNLGYPVLSWQKLSDNITPAGFEGNCLGVTTFSGNQASPYQVRYVKDLIYISNMVANDTNYSSKYFQMLNDINYNNGVIDSSSLYNPIGVYSNNKPFSGNFNGLRNAIANYSFSDTTKNNIGFFGYTNLATIQRLGISNINICAKDTVGGLVANGDSTKIWGCFVYGFIKGKNSVGGLVGVGTGATSAIDTSFTNTSIDAQTNVGGLVGNHSGGTINNSYSNSEIYSSTTANNYVGGIIGRASSSSNINYVYSTCKIIRNGTNTNFGKIKGNTQGTTGAQCYSRDNVFVNCDNITPSGYNGTSMNNAGLRNPTFATSTLGSANWKADYSPDRINDGYPILKYQPAAVKPNSSGLWPTTTASQVVIIKSGVQLKANSTYFPKCAYVKIEAGGELNNTTNINLFGEYNRELYVGKWNLIGLSTYNQTLASLYNYADTSFKTFVKEFDYTTNNWSTTTTQGVNTKFEIGEGILVMPNYSLDDRLIIKSRIVSKGVLYNDTTYQVPNPTTSAGRFVSLANNYPASIKVTQANPPISGNADLIQGNLVYVYDADSGKWNNNLQTTTGTITKIKPSEGFFIATITASSIFHFNKSQINNTSGAKNIIKSNLIYITANTDNETRQAFLEYSFDADNDFDFQDGLMMFGTNPNSVEPFFRINAGKESLDSENRDLHILKDAFSTLPYVTELDLRSQNDNEVSLNFSNLPPDIHVYLLDSLLRNAQYLNENADYNLKVGSGDNENRLFLLFSYKKEDINELFKPEKSEQIRIWNYNNILHIEGKDLIRYEIYDILGNRLVEEETFEDDYQKSLSLKNGIYIVRTYSKTSTKTEKISIYN